MKKHLSMTSSFSRILAISAMLALTGCSASRQASVHTGEILLPQTPQTPPDRVQPHRVGTSSPSIIVDQPPPAGESAPAETEATGEGTGDPDTGVVATEAAESHASEAETAAGEGTLIEVRKGDTLSHLARRYQVSVAQLKQWNRLSSDRITIGQTLRLAPGDSTAAGEATAPAPSVTPPSPKPGVEGETYTVKPGDSLSAIAHAHRLRVADIKQANQLASDTILAGWKLLLPPPGADASASSGNRPSGPKPVAGLSGTTYTVQAGDSLSTIAHAHKVDIADIRQANQLQSDVLQIGWDLLVPDGKAPAAEPAPATNSVPASTPRAHSGAHPD